MRVVIFAVIFLWTSLACAEMVKTYKAGIAEVESTSTAEIEEMFRQNDYDDYTQIRGKYPRIYLKSLPTDWQTVPENDAKHRTFIRILLPLVLRINEEIAAERAEIERLIIKFIKESLSAEEINYIEEKAGKYDIFTRMSGKERTELLLRELLKKVDAVPPSIMIASAAIYTEWGTSRLATEAHSLYQEEIWYTEEGLKPRDDAEAQYRYKVYDSLTECIRAHALKLNSHVNYDYFRESRRISRNMNRPPYGEQLAAKMMHDSNFKNIAGLIDYTFTFYKLNRTDYFPQLRDAKPF